MNERLTAGSVVKTLKVFKVKNTPPQADTVIPVGTRAHVRYTNWHNDTGELNFEGHKGGVHFEFDQVQQIPAILGKDNSHGIVFRDEDGVWKVYCGSLSGCMLVGKVTDGTTGETKILSKRLFENLLREKWTRKYAKWWCKPCADNPPQRRR